MLGWECPAGRDNLFHLINTAEDLGRASLSKAQLLFCFALTLMLLRLTSVRPLSLLWILSRVSSTLVGFGGSSGKILNGSAFTTPKQARQDHVTKKQNKTDERAATCFHPTEDAGAVRTVDALRVGDGACGAQSIVVLLVAHQRVHAQDGCKCKKTCQIKISL